MGRGGRLNPFLKLIILKSPKNHPKISIRLPKNLFERMASQKGSGGEDPPFGNNFMNTSPRINLFLHHHLYVHSIIILTSITKCAEDFKEAIWGGGARLK